MKLRALALAALLLAPAPALAQRIHVDTDDDGPGRVGRRYEPREAVTAIETTNREVALVLTRRVVALQLTDRTLRQAEHDMREDGKEDGFLARMIADVAKSAARSMLNHSIEYPLSEIRSADYRNGELILVTRDGDRLFADTDVNDRDVMRSFSPDQARAFVAQLNRMKRQIEL